MFKLISPSLKLSFANSYRLEESKICRLGKVHATELCKSVCTVQDLRTGLENSLFDSQIGKLLSDE